MCEEERVSTGEKQNTGTETVPELAGGDACATAFEDEDEEELNDEKR